MSKEEALSIVSDYLQFLSDNRVIRVPSYPYKIVQYLYEVFASFNKGDWFINAFRPGKGGYKEVSPTDDESFYIPDLSRVLENDIAWGFTWNSREYYETLNPRKAIIGAGVVIIDKVSQKLYHSPSFKSSDFMMDDYKSFKESGESIVDWYSREVTNQRGKWEYAYSS